MSSWIWSRLTGDGEGVAEKVEEGDGEKPGQGVGEAVEAGLGSLAQAAQKRIRKKIEIKFNFFI